MPCKVAIIILLFIASACWEVMCSSQRPHQNHPIAKRAALTSSQIDCISNVLDDTLNQDDTACFNVVQKISLLYTSVDVVSDISRELSAFPTFCRSSCGQVIINAWDACNAYDDVEDVAKLLIEMCASDGGSTCYSNFDDLFDFLDEGKSCYEGFTVSGSCSSTCSTNLLNGVQSYGCCVNVPIDYEDASENINDEANTILLKCGVTRPNRCINSPLNSPQSKKNSGASEKVSLVLITILTILYLFI